MGQRQSACVRRRVARALRLVIRSQQAWPTHLAARAVHPAQLVRSMPLPRPAMPIPACEGPVPRIPAGGPVPPWTPVEGKWWKRTLGLAPSLLHTMVPVRLVPLEDLGPLLDDGNVGRHSAWARVQDEGRVPERGRERVRRRRRSSSSSGSGESSGAGGGWSDQRSGCGMEEDRGSGRARQARVDRERRRADAAAGSSTSEVGGSSRAVDRGRDGHRGPTVIVQKRRRTGTVSRPVLTCPNSMPLL